MGEYMLMPKLDMSMEKGTIVSWLVKEGDKIEKNDYVVEVETGKVSIQVDNTVMSGIVLKIYYELGDTVDVNCPILYIGKAGEVPPSKEDAMTYSLTDTFKEIYRTESAGQDRFDYDLIVLGGGPGGYTCAIRASQLGKKALIIEKNEIGGICLNKGCIPTKSFIKNAQVLQTVKNAREMGIDIPVFKADWKEVLRRKNEVVESLQKGLNVVLKQNNVTVMEGEGRITDKNTVAVGERKITATHVVLATGSRQKKSVFSSDATVDLYFSEEILDLQELPQSMVISGGGVIGLEMAYVFNEYGVKVKVVDSRERIVMSADKEISKFLERELKNSGIEFLLGCSVEKTKNGKVILSDGNAIEAQVLFISDKRKAVVPNCYADIRLTPNHFIQIDENMQTSLENLYAIGDCCGKNLTAQAATRQGNVLAENLFGMKSKINYETIPTCLFSYPEAAWIGLTEEEARGRKIPIKVSKTRFSSVGKALASGQTQGLVKVIADSRWDEILGVHIIGANATDIIAQAAIAITAELCSSDIANTVFAHPTFSEAFMDACGGLTHKYTV